MLTPTFITCHCFFIVFIRLYSEFFLYAVSKQYPVMIEPKAEKVDTSSPYCLFFAFVDVYHI